MNTQILETKKYIIIRVPKSAPFKFKVKKATDFAKLAGVLRRDKRFRGMSSVDVQHRAFEI